MCSQNIDFVAMFNIGDNEFVFVVNIQIMSQAMHSVHL